MKRSFTLFETIVAISVILTGLVSVMSLVRMSISTSSIFQNRIIASNLAQEGIELVRNKAKSNLLGYPNPIITDPYPVCDPAVGVGDPEGEPCNPAPFGLSEEVDTSSSRWSGNYGPCVSENKTGNSNDIGCYIIWQSQTDIDTAELAFDKCPAVGCPRLNFDESTGLYSYDSSAEPTQFVRTITVDDAESRTGGIPYEYDELYVTSSVTWPTRFGSEQKVEFSTHLSL